MTQTQRYVVIDAGPAIRLKQLDKFGSNLYTTSGVLSEVREKQARTMLSYLPCDLKVRLPTPQDIAFVRSFARKTGDLGFLSPNDIELIALTLMLQRETGEVAHLNQCPKPSNIVKHDYKHNAWIPPKVNRGPRTEKKEEDGECGEEVECLDEKNVDDCVEENNVNECVKEENVVECAVEEENVDECAEENVEEKENSCENDGESEGEWITCGKRRGKIAERREIIVESCENEYSEEEEDEEALESCDDDARDDDELSCDGSDAGEWVTSENFSRFNTNVGDATSETEYKVACVTTDYSVQNVLMQIGLHVLAIDGYRIRELKLWGLLCRACGTSTRDTTKLWCPKCGHATVDRVPVTIDSETNQMIVHDNRRRIRTRGIRYSIPENKGGRNRGPIFAEDELMMGGRMREIRRAQKLRGKEQLAHDPFADNTGDVNQWCVRHVTRSGTFVNAHAARVIVGYGRKNPNANNFHKRTGNKK